MRLIVRYLAAEILITLALLPAPAAFALQSPRSPARSAAVTAPEDRTDINSAPLDQLLKVPGMTRIWAARIVRFRPYHAKNDLVDRGVVTSQVYDRIKNFIIAHRAAH